MARADVSFSNAHDTDPFGRLSYGAAALGNLFQAVDDETAAETLATAWELGIRYFDTAPHYGLGLSERRVGEFLRGKPRDEFQISTKVGRLLEPTPERAHLKDDTWFDVPAATRRRWDYSAEGIRRSLEDSLDRLGLDSVDILYLHDPEQFGVHAEIPGAVQALIDLREEGLVGRVGVGTSDVDILRSIVRTADIDLIMLSNRYTLLNREAADELLPECRERGVGVVNVGVFNSGILASPTPRDDAHYEYGAVTPSVLAHARRLADVCRSHGVELPAAALQFSLRDPSVLTVAVGAGRAEQLRQNRAWMDAPIPEALWGDL
ncbi:aldo/keto reductase [Glaciibacter psychrotolerans]|uniref:D-threo-aldose 1-dehydrogenase n=1 Tax=Glaciibacter psychrotolerans TaxID=670054 RepID=A0A7Z0EGB7_9MICO|nr:aldo/keto reductase [Leifsonia psychrotolerans]NYJ21147.1 D-threo-aldose 1-dehydrogenase [Leifsonia psychrotolerans]